MWVPDLTNLSILQHQSVTLSGLMPHADCRFLLRSMTFGILHTRNANVNSDRWKLTDFFAEWLILRW
jgi:hypothetical protein